MTTLTVTRRAGERIQVTTPGGERIVIAVREIRRNRIRVSVSAPRDCVIVREELLERQRGAAE